MCAWRAAVRCSACTVGGLGAGIALSAVARRCSQGLGVWMATSATALLMGAMGCVCIGSAGLAGLLVGYSLGGAPFVLPLLLRPGLRTKRPPTVGPRQAGSTQGSTDDWIPRTRPRMNPVEMVAFRARVLPILAALLLALPLGAVGGAQYFCHAMGRLMNECCCTPVAAVPSVVLNGCSSQIKSRDCCERLERASSDAAPVLREKAASPKSTAAVVERLPRVVMASEPDARDVVPEQLVARAPPPRGPPLFLANCSFLI